MSEPFIGEIRIVGFNFAPRGWANCDGQLLSIAQNSALFSLLGTVYGGDGRTTFGLPDLRGRVPVHAGNGPGLSPRAQGQKSGAEQTTLSVANLPSHTHAVKCNSDDGDTDEPQGNFPAKAGGGETIYASGEDAAMSNQMVGNTGGGSAANNMQPFLTVRFVVALVGLFPSRN